jgi:hypothetical protein
MAERRLPTTDQVVFALERAAERTRARGARAEALAVAGVAIGLVIAWLAIYATGGAVSLLLPLMYLPIIGAGLTLGMFGGVLTAVAAGTMMGPLMPLDVGLDTAQPLETAAARAAFYLLIGAGTAAFATSSRVRHQVLEESKQRLADISVRNLRLFARLVSERDEKTGGHCERVANNTVIVAQALGIKGTALKNYYWAGLLHDLGKLGVPEAVLQKGSHLDGEEMRVIRTHPAFGEEILLAISESFSDIAIGVRSHHERWDGMGYPDGLVGEEIPLVGRILAVVDVYEAVTSFRPYRGPMGSAEARRVIQEGAGGHFDPKIAAIFLALERNGQITRETEPVPLFDVFATGVIEGRQRNPDMVN